MGADSRISWCDHTFNTWRGCARVSRACRFCYAERDTHHWQPTAQLWRRYGPRQMMSDQYWKAPLRWNRQAEAAGTVARVFCSSLADVFEDHSVAAVHAQQDAARARLWNLIDQTPWLVWMLLTKRPHNVADMVPWGTSWPANVWIGTSVEDQARAEERIPDLLSLRAAVRFISAEPLVGPLRLRPQWCAPSAITCTRGGRATVADLAVLAQFGRQLANTTTGGRRYLDWVITGGESGPRAEPSHPDWFRELRDQSVHYGLPFHFKQWGQWSLEPAYRPDGAPKQTRFHSLANDGTLYAPGDLAFPNGPRYADAVRAGHHTAALTAVYRVGKKVSGRELDGQIWDQYPPSPEPVIPHQRTTAAPTATAPATSRSANNLDD